MSWDPATVVGYTTVFPDTEFTVAGRWQRGGTDGLVFTDPVVIAGTNTAQGSQTGSNGFDDSHAAYTALDVADCRIETTLVIGALANIIEHEHHHRRRIVNNLSTGYEITVGNPGGGGGAYCDFYKWLGLATPQSQFVALVPSLTYHIPSGLQTGHLFRTEMIGDTISAFYNKLDGNGWIHIGDATDTSGAGGHAAYSSGHPGLGFYRESNSSAASTVRVSRWTATPL